jgi:NTP pyrophosphatase (non-canonical NTP hydrolase)
MLLHCVRHALYGILMSDKTTTIHELREMIRVFVEKRDWRQFHSPKNLSMALAIEAAELMEHFQWIDVPASREVALDDAKRAAAGEELADVIAYGFALANELGLDVADTIRDKMAKNIRKYPAEEFRGRWGRNDPGGAPRGK